MRITICAVGRLRCGPELALIQDYCDRFDKTGRSMGLGPISFIEVEDKKNIGMSAEAELLERAIPKGSLIVTMDERGRTVSSPEFADQLARWRDNGAPDCSFIIGGADGIDPSLRAKADFSISFGQMVWPHMLVRVMLSEQLYRAATILGNGPYHRA